VCVRVCVCVCVCACACVCIDNYLAMEVACTMVCPKANQEMIISHPDGSESQKCEKCDGDCPKGGSTSVQLAC